MTKAEMRATIQKIHSAIIMNIPDGVTDKEMMYIYQKTAHMLLTETTEWAHDDYTDELED